MIKPVFGCLKPFALCLIHLICLTFSLDAADASSNRIKMLYNSLDPSSLSQHLAFYELYASHPLGQQALKDSWALLTGSRGNSPQFDAVDLPLSSSTIQSIVSLVNKSSEEMPLISPQDLLYIEKLASRLGHVRLQGHYAASEHEVLGLPTEEIDVARGLFLSQFGSEQQKIRSYEAMIDLMALQILARLPSSCSPERKIREINRFIFEEMGFRFPPHSLYAKDIDLYTFLPSVLDSHRGVCLGVSILYLCLAQRLNLNLEMITPPGHIYVRHRSSKSIINIETTARGIHLDSDEYLSIETCGLQQRTIKEVIGLAHFNQAAGFLQKEDYAHALACYQKAEPYLKDDGQLKELMGYTYLLTGNEEAGKDLLEQIKDYIPNYRIARDTMAEDYLKGYADKDCLKAIFTHVDEDRQSILAKKEQLESIVIRYPYFRAGYFHLAVTWLQLHRTKEALEALKKYYHLNPEDPEANYYLAVLYEQRQDYTRAWKHLKNAEAFTKRHHHYPKALKKFRQTLILCCPE